MVVSAILKGIRDDLGLFGLPFKLILYNVFVSLFITNY
jgi:hypothetical protein